MTESSNNFPAAANRAVSFLSYPIYGTELKDGSIVMTGGLIKATEKMTGDNFEKEFAKLERVKRFLKEQGITDRNGLLGSPTCNYDECIEDYKKLEMDENEKEVLDADYSEYLTLDNLREKLNELRNLNLTNLSKEEIAKIFFGYLKSLPCLTAIYPPEKFNTFNFYRVRLGVNPEMEDLSLIRTFSYPSSHFCSKNGRANLKNKSVFYCSNSALTPVMESKPKVGEVGYLSVWKAKTNRKMKAGLFLPEDLRVENEWRGVCDDIYSHAGTESLTTYPEKFPFFLETLRFISRLYLDEAEPYYLTSWISDQMLHGLTWKDFIVYPSYMNEGYSCNMAIHPNVVDKYLEFKKVIRFKHTKGWVICGSFQQETMVKFTTQT